MADVVNDDRDPRRDLAGVVVDGMSQQRDAEGLLMRGPSELYGFDRVVLVRGRGGVPALPMGAPVGPAAAIRHVPHPG